MQHPALQPILKQLRQGLETLYNEQLAEIILYGSQARGDATPGSDIDILLTLHPPFDYITEIHRTTPLIADLCLQHEVLVSVAIAPERDRHQPQAPFYINLRRDGISA